MMKIKIYHAISKIPDWQWKKLEHPHFPFSDYEFHLCLELGACLGPTSGWEPYYLTLWEDEQLLGAVYLYRKSNSYGEFIFDWEWAQAYQRLGRPYYPKLTSAVPFTPATGAKLLVNSHAKNPEQIRRALIAASLDLAKELNVSGLHFLFIPKEEIPDFQSAGMEIRYSYQFHWQNQNYQDYTQFLQNLKRKRRQQFQKERREVQRLPLKIHTLTGVEILPEHLEMIYQFYLSTIRKNWSHPYLTKEFFQLLPKYMKNRLLIYLAKAGSQWVAGSINFFKGENLYGRYWGCRQEYPYLHFELCYYRNIEYAILHQWQHFEAGAQGGHKMLRGLSPVLTYSAHEIFEPHFRSAIAQYIETERVALLRGLEEAKQHDAYKGQSL